MQLTPAQVEDEIRFWLAQDREHALFYALGFHDPMLKRQAEAIYNDYSRALNAGDVHSGMNILRRSQEYKSRALAQLAGGWQGFIYPSFIEHTKLELDAMMLRVSKQGLPDIAEVCFWNRINADHAAFAAHLLDPTETLLHDTAMKASRDIGKLAIDSCAQQVYPTLLQMSREGAASLDAFVSDPALLEAKSIIHPVLAAHVQREGQRALATLNAIREPLQVSAA